MVSAPVTFAPLFAVAIDRELLLPAPSVITDSDVDNVSFPPALMFNKD